MYLADEEYDSTDSADYNPRVQHQVPRHIHTIRCAARRWNSMGEELKAAWGERAERLNLRPLSGSFLFVPEAIGGDSYDGLRCSVLAALSEDWRIIWRMFNTILKRPVRKGQSKTTYSFGGEKVTLGLQCFKYFVLPSLLRQTLFGRNNFKLQDSEIITRNNNITMIHIASQERMSKLFCCYDLNAAVHRNGLVMHTFCGKVGIVCTSNNKNVFGYIMDEVDEGWEILLETHERIWFDRSVVAWDRKLKKYKYNKELDDEGRYIDSYSPWQLQNDVI